MSISPMPAQMPPVGSAVLVVEAVHEVLSGIDPSVPVPRAEIAATVREIDRAINRLTAAKLALVAQADRDRVHTATGAASTSAWLDATTRAGGARASAEVGLATALDAELPVARAALTDGSLSATNASIVAAAMRALPAELTSAERARVEERLVADAQRLTPQRLRVAARRALAAARPALDVDAHQDTQLRSAEDRALAAAHLSFHDAGDGTTRGAFVLPTLAASILRKVVDQLASPRRNHDHDHDHDHDGTMPVIDWGNRRGRAFADLLEHLPTDHLHGKTAATIVVTITHDALVRGLGVAHTDTGHDLSAADARRLACTAGLLPAVLGGTSQILDLGRTARYFTQAQRLALATRYDTCAAADCDRPYAWTDLHHQTPWAAQHGHTDLEAAVPLCGHHHRRIHDPRYHHDIHTHPDRRKTVTYRLRT